MKRAVIYIRVSTGKQVEGASMGTQEEACQQWCAKNEIIIDSIFKEEGASAKTIEKRPAMKKMLKYLADNPKQAHYVVTYQTDRISRNMDDFVFMRTMLKKLGIEYKNTNSSLESSPAENLVVNMSVAVAEFDNEQKSERVTSNMKRHAKEGYRMSKAPHGLKNVRDLLGKSTVAPVEGIADKVTAVLEAYSTGAETIASLIKMCETVGLKSAQGKPMRIQALSKMLRNPIYAGLEQNCHTDNQLINSSFEGIITPVVFYRNQELLKNNKNTAAKYKKNNPMYPLRRFLICNNCHQYLTGSAPKGGSGKYSPRYSCSRCRGIPSIRIEELHEQFLHLLSSLAPDPDSEKFLKEMIVRVWREETQALSVRQKKVHKIIESLTEKRARSVEMLVAGQITVEEKNELVKMINNELYEKRKELDNIGSLAELKIDAVDYALSFMSNAPRIWSSISIEHQIIYQKLLFPEGLKYDLSKNEFGTVKLSKLYTLANIKKDPSESKESLMVTLLGENWNTFWQELERFDAGFQDIIPEEDV